MQYSTVEYAAAALILFSAYYIYSTYYKSMSTAWAVIFWVALSLVIVELSCYFTDNLCELSVARRLGVDFSDFKWSQGCKTACNK